MDIGYSVQLDHLLLFFTYNIDNFSKFLFPFELFSNKKLGIGTSFAQVKIDPKLEVSPVYLSFVALCLTLMRFTLG